jgi:hypothetical protein
MANNCIQLQDGKLYTCVLPPYIKFFNEYYAKDISVTEQDYIDIYKANDINEILNFLNKPIPFCRYCDIKNMSFNIKWAVSNKDIKEWVE